MRVGIDFGTTNSSVARICASGEVEMAVFSAGDAYRSLLYLEQSIEGIRKTVKSWTGPEGIARYLEADEARGRLIQSLKSFLTSRSLQSTDVFGRRIRLEELIARILIDLREKAGRQFGVEIRSAVVGRPVHFVGAEDEAGDDFAQSRLSEAFRIAGFESVQFEMEPVAAAHYYESTLDHNELILIGDFGGGTSDFSLVHVGPSAHELRGNSGVGIAGDAFDAKIIRKLVSPALGAGTQLRSMEKILPVPIWIYAKLERWHHLSLLKAKDTMDMLASVRGQAFEPEKIGGLLHLIREDRGYQLHRAVQKVKCDLSENSAARFRYSDGVVNLDAKVLRSEFEGWIADELRQMEECVDSLLKASGAEAKDIDMVFLTGGSSFVPAVRRIFESRFGAECIRAGNEFTSVARGLALKGAALQ